MERPEPDYEDEKIRRWSVSSELNWSRDDPTVLKLGQDDEVFETRVYNADPYGIVVTAIAEMRHNPEVTPADVVEALEEALDGASFHILAKRSTTDDLLTFILVGTIGDQRTLLSWRDRVEEPVFRAFVADFEQEMGDAGLIQEPTIMTEEEWRSRGAGGEPPAPPPMA